jgi:putative restriction endonuclease
LTPDQLDIAVRTAAFAYLVQQRTFHGDPLSRTLLDRGFQFGNQTIRLLGPQGIFKPAILDDMPLSFITVPEIPGKPRPYEDEKRSDGLITYRYRGEDPLHRDNPRLRRAMQKQVPLIYLIGVSEGSYFPVFPVHVVRSDVLKEHDGPMLRDGLQGLDRTQLVVPTRAEHRPNPAFLEERYELFTKAV